MHVKGLAWCQPQKCAFSITATAGLWGPEGLMLCSVVPAKMGRGSDPISPSCGSSHRRHPKPPGASDPRAGRGEGGTWPKLASRDAGRESLDRRAARAKAETHRPGSHFQEES